MFSLVIPEGRCSDRPYLDSLCVAADFSSFVENKHGDGQPATANTACLLKQMKKFGVCHVMAGAVPTKLTPGDRGQKPPAVQSSPVTRA